MRSVPLALALAALPSDDCVLWTGVLDHAGYARVRRGPDRPMAHRAVYELLVGPIPEGLEIDHLCRNRSCVNPTHLEPVTHKVNSLRGDTAPAKNAAKETCDYGHPFDYVSTRGERICRRCRARRHAEHQRRKTVTT